MTELEELSTELVHLEWDTPLFRTAQAPAVFGAMNSLSVIWTVGLSVLGVYVYKRSEEKRMEG